MQDKFDDQNDFNGIPESSSSQSAQEQSSAAEKARKNPFENPFYTKDSNAAEQEKKVSYTFSNETVESNRRQVRGMSFLVGILLISVFSLVVLLVMKFLSNESKHAALPSTKINTISSKQSKAKPLHSIKRGHTPSSTTENKLEEKVPKIFIHVQKCSINDAGVYLSKDLHELQQKIDTLTTRAKLSPKSQFGAEITELKAKIASVHLHGRGYLLEDRTLLSYRKSSPNYCNLSEASYYLTLWLRQAEEDLARLESGEIPPEKTASDEVVQVISKKDYVEKIKVKKSSLAKQAREKNPGVVSASGSAVVKPKNKVKAVKTREPEIRSSKPLSSKTKTSLSKQAFVSSSSAKVQKTKVKQGAKSQPKKETPAPVYTTLKLNAKAHGTKGSGQASSSKQIVKPVVSRESSSKPAVPSKTAQVASSTDNIKNHVCYPWCEKNYHPKEQNQTSQGKEKLANFEAQKKDDSAAAQKEYYCERGFYLANDGYCYKQGITPQKYAELESLCQ